MKGKSHPCIPGEIFVVIHIMQDYFKFMRALLSGKSRSARYTLCSRATRGQLVVFSFRLDYSLLDSTLWPTALRLLSCDIHHKQYVRRDEYVEKSHMSIFFTNERATFVGIIVAAWFHSIQMILKVSGRSNPIRISWNLVSLFPQLTTLNKEPSFQQALYNEFQHHHY